jgi:putative ABC transport system ATP-binding protein
VPLIAVRDLTRTFSIGEIRVPALAGVTLDIDRGEFVALTGPSGSGKSTFMHILGCLDRPTSGQYLLDGQHVGRLTPDELAAIRNRKLGFVFQGFNLLARTSALDNVELPLLYDAAARSGSQRRARARAALDAVGLGDRANHHPNQLSGGQQQRVAIARALVNNPSILLADEPTGNLDSRTSVEVMEIFQRLNDQRKITVVLVTHEPDIAEYGIRIIGFRDGRVVSDRPTAKRRAASAERAALPTPA